MRFFYQGEGNPRLDYVNSLLRLPVLFAPAEEVKAASFAAFYGAGPRKLSDMMARPDTLSGDTCTPCHGDLKGDAVGDAVTPQA